MLNSSAQPMLVVASGDLNQAAWRWEPIHGDLEGAWGRLTPWNARRLRHNIPAHSWRASPCMATLPSPWGGGACRPHRQAAAMRAPWGLAAFRRRATTAATSLPTLSSRATAAAPAAQAQWMRLSLQMAPPRVVARVPHRCMQLSTWLSPAGLTHADSPMVACLGAAAVRSSQRGPGSEDLRKVWEH